MLRTDATQKSWVSAWPQGQCTEGSNAVGLASVSLGIASPNSGAQVPPSVAGGIASPTAWGGEAEFGQSRGGCCRQDEAPIADRLIANIVWQANESGMAESLELLDPKTGLRLQPSALSLNFRVINTSITRQGTVVLFGNYRTGSMAGRGAIVNRRGLLPTFFNHTLLAAKTSAPTSVKSDVLVCDQDSNMLYRINLARVWRSRNEEVTLDPSDPQHRDFRWSAPTSFKPRGVVQSRTGKVWVACKGGNRAGDPASAIQSFLFRDYGGMMAGARIDDIRSDFRGEPIPFGARGICVEARISCEARASYDEIWVTCFGQQPRPPNEDTGDGNRVVRIVDKRSPGQPHIVVPRSAVQIIQLGGDPNAKRGPFGIAASAAGDKFVACGRSNEVWKIPRGIDLRPLRSGGRLVLLERAAGRNWPVHFAGADGGPQPNCVSIDGNGGVWVQFKNANRIVRLNAESGAIEVDRPIHYPGGSPDANAGRPENLGDFTGYWTALGLYPCDDSNNDGRPNQESLVGAISRVNPFVPYAEL